jgi:hypothetical protein
VGRRCEPRPRGQFLLEDVPGGDYVFTVGDHVSRSQRVRPGSDAEVRVEIATRPLRIHLVDSASKKPIVNERLWVGSIAIETLLCTDEQAMRP